MNILYIDTRDNKNVLARITTNKGLFEEKSINTSMRPDSILLLIEKACLKAGVKVNDIDEINVEEGPGSYTGLKVGISVANALSFSLEKKVNGKKFGELIEPRYE